MNGRSFVCYLFSTGVVILLRNVLGDEIFSYEDVQYSEGDELGSGLPINLNRLMFNASQLPTCMDDELLAFNGTEFTCKKIPERKCICPSPIVGSGEPPPLPPEPPGGCTVFEPPEGGGFVCLSLPTMIYCSVYCDTTHEFSMVPHNPYFCGQDTKFVWKDFTGMAYYTLPECTGFRYSARPFHNPQFYFPAPCELVTVDQAEEMMIKSTFCRLLALSRVSCDPSASNVFVQCPRTTAAAATTLAEENPNANP